MVSRGSSIGWSSPQASSARKGTLFEPSCSEHVYWELLHELAAKDGVRTRVVVDVISGTSAGGINGVFLAKAIAHDLSQKSLRDLWFEEADIGKLLTGPRPWTRSGSRASWPGS